jgi:hypothetical protein
MEKYGPCLPREARRSWQQREATGLLRMGTIRRKRRSAIPGSPAWLNR